jgi:hypothetical protein
MVVGHDGELAVTFDTFWKAERHTARVGRGREGGHEFRGSLAKPARCHSTSPRRISAL